MMVSDKVRLIDVGARSGIHERWRSFHEQIDVRAFEPDPDECAALNAGTYPYRIRFLPVALGAEDDQRATLHICRSPGCSSILTPNHALIARYDYGEMLEVVGRREITLTRLDRACADFPPDVIKIDTQGTELDVLRGAGDLLDTTLAVELEVEFLPLYEGQAVFADVDIFMRSRGFTLRGLRRPFWREKADQRHAYGGQLIHGDALYLRSERMDCAKGHVILAAYRQYDLLARFGVGHLIPREPVLTRLACRLLARRPNHELRRLVDRIRPATATDWHDPDFY